MRPGERGPLADQSISCPSCGKKIPLTRALRAEIEASLKHQFDETLQDRERELRAHYESRLEKDLQRAQADAAKKAEKRVARLVTETQERLAEEHPLKQTEKKKEVGDTG